MHDVREYKAPLGIVIVILLFCLPLLTFAASAIYFLQAPHALSTLLVGYAFATLCIAGIIALITGLFRWRVWLSASGIKVRIFFNNRDMLFAEMAGYQLAANSLYIIPADQDEKSLILPLSIWYEPGFVLTGVEEYRSPEQVEQAENISRNKELGSDESSRFERWKSLKSMTRYINTASIILILPIFLAPVWLFGYCFCLPLILLVLYRNYDGLIKLNPAARSNEPAIDDPLLTIVLSLGVSAFMNFPLTAYLPVVLYAAFAAAIILCALLLFLRPVLSREARDTFFMAVSLGEVFIFALSFCIFTNCHFDNSHPIYTHQAVVTGMRNGHARSIDPFHLRLQRTDSREAIMYVDVPNSIYFNLDKGDTVLASFKQGLLNGNWYEVRKAGKKE